MNPILQDTVGIGHALVLTEMCSSHERRGLPALGSEADVRRFDDWGPFLKFGGRERFELIRRSARDLHPEIV